MEDLLTDLTTSWNGLLILTGDFNIDLFQPNAELTKQYLDPLEMFNLSQHVKEATRTTPISRTLIDHIISNNPKRETHTGVLPCSNISDHDGPYACLNIHADRFVPRFKILRSERNFAIERYIRDFEQPPFSIIYCFYDPNDKLDIFNTLIIECIENHAPLKRMKITRPPAPWLHQDEIRSL